MTSVDPVDLIVFGGSGDLAMRKLLPGIYHLHKNGHLPESSRVIGVARSEVARDAYLSDVENSCRQHVPAPDFTTQDWQKFAEQLDYLQMDAARAEDYGPLAERLREEAQRIRVFYLATTSELFPLICEHLARAGLITPQSRVVLEKPIGYDLASAQRISERVSAVFAEQQIYRIDHYLGKETVQNLIALRFGNALFEPLWRRSWISHVQITVAEEIGVTGQGKVYEQTGALRDMVQNHLLQLLCILAMEPPTSIDPDAVRDEKLKVLRALHPLSGEEAISKTVRGQYRAGTAGRASVPGYGEEPGIAPDSRTETFVALKAEIDTWRWAGVPFYLRTGKRLAERVAEIVVVFREVPHLIFETASGLMSPNHLVIRLQPDEGLKLFLMAKAPGDEMRLRPVSLNLGFAETFKAHQTDPHERLLIEIIRGRLALFVRHDELQAAWRWIDPILKTWEAEGDRPRPYTAGTWGPAAATVLISRDGFSWYEES